MPVSHHPPRVGDDVLYVPDCNGDRCAHPPIFNRAAKVNQVNGDGTVGVTVFHPESVAMVPDVVHGGPGQLRSWYRRDEETAVSPTHGLDSRLAVDWPPILAAARDLNFGWIGEPDFTALGGALGKLLAAIPDAVLERHLAGRDAGCPVGECGHLSTSHEPDEYGADGAPVRPICCIDGCPCGDKWRNA